MLPLSYKIFFDSLFFFLNILVNLIIKNTKKNKFSFQDFFGKYQQICTLIWLATQIIFTYRCFKYFHMFQFLCMFHFLWKVIYFMKNYIILYYSLDFKYDVHSLFTGVFVTNYAN